MTKHLRFSIFLILVLPLLLASCRSNSASTGANVQSPSGSGSYVVTAEELFLPVSAPAKQGLDEAALNRLITQAENGEFGALDSLIIIRNDHIVLERYFRQQSREKLHRLYSVTKSVASLLVGIALDKQLIENIRQPMLSFFPEYNAIENLDGRKQAVTLQDLLTMRAGFLWDEWSTPYTTPGNPTTDLFNSADWIKHMLDQPMAHQPGTVFTYNSGVSILLSGVIKSRTGMATHKFAEQALFGPLGILGYDWETGPNEIDNTGWGLFLRSLDMAKIGYLVLKGGRWEGTQIVSSEWISVATRNHVGTPAYGYQWWMRPQTGLQDHAPRDNDIWTANGWGGQFIFVVPLSDMVVVMNAENYENPVGASKQSNELFPAILSAIRD